jgi:hypothetical protein
MDWATVAIEAVGLLILGIWIVVPVHEFRQIFARIQQQDRDRRDDSNAGAPPAP